MTQKNVRNMKLAVSALTLCLVAQQSLTSQASAGMITGIAPEIVNGNKVYNIPASVANGDIGFRLYSNFKLNPNEIANLIFMAESNGKDISKFVNLVDNTIDIQGLVNAVGRDGRFNNGNVMFVSPKGMVVGASGVLNVGSLTILTPDQNKYDRFKTDYDIRGDLSDLYSEGTGTVTIDGKVIARNAVDIRAANVNINNTIMSGVRNSDVFDKASQAENLFNSLVNTDNLKAGNSFANDNGSIKITSYSGDGGVTIAQGSTLKNFGAGNIEVLSKGSKGIIADGDIKNPNGNTLLTTTAGTINVNGNVINQNGNITADSANGIIVAQAGKIQNTTGNTSLLNTGTTGIEVKGEVTNNDGDLLFDNSATGGINIDGRVNSVGNADIINKNGNLNINNGARVNHKSTAGNHLNITNSGNKLYIDGEVYSENGNVNINNTGDGGLHVDKNAIITSAVVGNPHPTLEINNPALNISNNSAASLDIDGTLTADGSYYQIKNSGAGALNINEGANVNGYISKESYIINDGDGGLNIAGNVYTNNGSNSTKVLDAGLTIENNNAQSGIVLAPTGNINSENSNHTSISNSGEKGIVIQGKINQNINNFAKPSRETLKISNTGKDGILIASNGRVNNTSATKITNTGENGINVKGLIKTNGLNVENSNSNVVIGDSTENDYYITSSGDVNINVDNGNIYNYGVVKTLIKTTNGANLTMNVKEGAIGKNVGTCLNGMCTGIGGADARDLTKSVNVEVDGLISAYSTGDGIFENSGNKSLINIASLNHDMNINEISADGRVILLADDKDNKGANPYNILNKAVDSNKPNIKGQSISVIASGSIGEKDNKVTFIQTESEFDDKVLDSADFSYTKPKNSGGVDMLAIKDINVKGLDNEDGSKNDTHVCAMISREGSIDAEFSGDTYIGQITAENRIDIVNRGKNIYIENLGSAPSYYPEPGDYYGNKDNITPDRVTVTALDLGTSWPDNPADSTVIIKNGQIAGDGKGRPSKDQDLTITADNAYVGGYYFNMGKDRMPGHSTVTPDNRTNPITNPDSETTPSIRAEAVRPYDVTDIGQDADDRNYYYGSDEGEDNPNGTGSDQGDDPNYDGKDNPSKDDPDGPKDDDNLVIPPAPGDDDDDDDGPNPPQPGDDDDDDDDGPNPPQPGDDDDDDDDDDGPNPPQPGDDDDDDDDGPNPPQPGDDDDDDDDGPNPPQPGDDDDDDDDGPNPPQPGDDDDDDDDGPNPPQPGDDDDDDDGPNPPQPGDDDDDNNGGNLNPSNKVDEDAAKLTWKKEYNDYMSVIDKRQYMRFNINNAGVPVAFEGTDKISSLVDISRGGIAVRHNSSLKVGDVIPVHISYGDIDINTNVKVVMATDNRAGAEFVDLDTATANRILYLNLLLEERQMLTLSGQDNQI